jgi:hypothetical protein
MQAYLRNDVPSELLGEELARGHYCPKEHKQHLELGYTQIATISTDDHHTLQEFRASVGAQDLDIREYADPDRNPMIPHKLMLKPGLVIPSNVQRLLVLGPPSVIDLLSSLQEEVGRFFSSLMFRHRVPESRQVDAGKQCFSLAEYDRRQRQVQGIDRPCLQKLPHRGNTASDPDILVAGRVFRKPQRLLGSAGDKVESRPALHDQRLPLVVRQNESFRMVRRVVAPPSPP